MRIQPGEPITCPACGGVYEGPTTYEDDNGVTHRLSGHVQGDAICSERRPTVRKRTNPAPVQPTARWSELTQAERDARESAVRAKLAAERNA